MPSVPPPCAAPRRVLLGDRPAPAGDLGAAPRATAELLLGGRRLRRVPPGRRRGAAAALRWEARPVPRGLPHPLRRPEQGAERALALRQVPERAARGGGRNILSRSPSLRQNNFLNSLNYDIFVSISFRNQKRGPSSPWTAHTMAFFFRYLSHFFGQVHPVPRFRSLRAQAGPIDLDSPERPPSTSPGGSSKRFLCISWSILRLSLANSFVALFKKALVLGHVCPKSSCEIGEAIRSFPCPPSWKSALSR